MAATQQSFMETSMGGTSNDSASPTGFLAIAIADIQHSTGKYIVAGIMMAVAFFVHRYSFPPLAINEPRIIHPRIPIIGHILGMVKDQSGYFNALYNKYKMPIATLPILGGKTYAVWDPDLAASAMRLKSLTFVPLAVEAAQKMLGMDEKQYEPFLGTPDRPSLVPEFFEALHGPMRGESLHRMNANALNYISSRLDTLITDDGWAEIPNVYLWIRNLMTLATSTALLGEHNPLKDPKLVDDMWTWEVSIPLMLTIPAHSITLPAAYKARENLQAAMARYYKAKHDMHESTADVTKARSAVLRKYKVPETDIGRFECSLVQLSTGNTIPTTFWTMTNICSRPELIERLRQEITPHLVHGENGEVTFNIAKLEEHCPLLVSCYRESNRLFNHVLNVRKIVEDTTLSDGKGNSYLLKKDCVLQIPTGFSHGNAEVWGADVGEFNPDRFIPTQTKGQRGSYMPFGGGRHLCPGRYFALAEILGFISALTLGFEVYPIEGEHVPWKLPAIAPSAVFGGVLKPVNGGENFGFRIRRRAGWEKVRWNFVC